MKRSAILLVSLMTIFSFGLAGFANVQDSATPTAEVNGCATPVASATPTVEATPATGTPEAADPCATPGADESSEVVVIELVDIAFLPNKVTIPADTDVTFQFINNGNMQHDFKIDDPEVYSGILNSGQEAEVVVNLPAGEYEFYCTIPGHKEGGMVGTLIVE